MHESRATTGDMTAGGEWMTLHGPLKRKGVCSVWVCYANVARVKWVDVSTRQTRSALAPDTRAPDDRVRGRSWRAWCWQRRLWGGACAAKVQRRRRLSASRGSTSANPVRERPPFEIGRSGAHVRADNSLPQPRTSRRAGEDPASATASSIMSQAEQVSWDKTVFVNNHCNDFGRSQLQVQVALTEHTTQNEHPFDWKELDPDFCEFVEAAHSSMPDEWNREHFRLHLNVFMEQAPERKARGTTYSNRLGNEARHGGTKLAQARSM